MPADLSRSRVGRQRRMLGDTLVKGRENCVSSVRGPNMRLNRLVMCRKMLARHFLAIVFFEPPIPNFCGAGCANEHTIALSCGSKFGSVL